MNFLKRLWYRLIGRSVQVSFIALPTDDLSIPFLYQIGKNGEWKAHRVSVAGMMISGLTPIETAMKYFDQEAVYHVKILKNKDKIKEAIYGSKQLSQELL
jgi:hypothetical protein